MGTLLFILFIVFIVVPIVRVMLTIYRARRQTRRFFDQFRTAAGGGASQQQKRPGDARQQPRRPKKKIDPSVGEYVAFEEIKSTVSESDADASAAYTEVEQQVEDVEWEDIK